MRATEGGQARGRRSLDLARGLEEQSVCGFDRGQGEVGSGRHRSLGKDGLLKKWGTQAWVLRGKGGHCRREAPELGSQGAQAQCGLGVCPRDRRAASKEKGHPGGHSVLRAPRRGGPQPGLLAAAVSCGQLWEQLWSAVVSCGSSCGAGREQPGQ